MTYDLILVPQGAEAAAVERGAKRAHANIPILAIAMGPEVTTQRLLSALHQGVFENKRRVLVLGVAGSLTASLQVGDVVVYETLTAVTPASSGSPAESDAISGKISGTLSDTLSGVDYSASPVDVVLGQLPQAQAVKALSHHRLVHLAQEKQTLHRQTGAAAVDMEAAAISQTLADANVELTTVRIISDSAQRDLPNLEGTQNADGSLNSWTMAIALLRQPRTSWTLIRGSLQALKVLESMTYELLK